MKPVGLFGADDSRRAMMPATNPISTIQRKPMIAPSDCPA
jgi:hypothetical protein